MEQRTCAGCDTPLPNTTGVGRPKKWCSRSCFHKAENRKQREQRASRPPKPRKANNPKPCERCGTVFTPKSAAARYCTDTDCMKQRRNERQRLTRRDADERYKAKQTQQPCPICTTPTRGTYCNRCAPIVASSNNWGECATCGKQSARTASNTCTACDIPHKRAAQRRAKAERKLARAARGTAGTTIRVQGRCHYCGVSFPPTASSSPARFCSGKCANGDRGSRRRARLHDVWIEPINRAAVFRRYNNTCHICDQAIDMSLPANDPMSATLDHVIPLIARGPHTESNLRPAHMSCNSMKSIDEGGPVWP